MACARLDAIGKDAGPILAKAGVTPEAGPRSCDPAGGANPNQAA